MNKNKKVQAAALNPMAETRSMKDIQNKTGNIYQSIAVVAKRAGQINVKVKEELHRKLDEFASYTDNLEEIHENKEQIEISRIYERMANPAIQALNEFMEDKVYFRHNDDEFSN